MTCGANWTNREAGLAEIVPVMVETVAQVTVGDSSKLMRTGRAKAKGGNPLGRRKQGADKGSSRVKARIKALTDAEDAKKILSDDALVDLLKDEGFDIARRTVAKYREALHIPSSVQRRREKALGL